MVETNEGTLKRRDEIVAEVDELLKHSGDTSIYSELHRMEGIMARAGVNWREQQLKSRDTSPQKNANEEVAQNTDGPDSFVDRCVTEVISLPEERSVCKQGTFKGQQNIIYFKNNYYKASDAPRTRSNEEARRN